MIAPDTLRLIEGDKRNPDKGDESSHVADELLEDFNTRLVELRGNKSYQEIVKELVEIARDVTATYLFEELSAQATEGQGDYAAREQAVDKLNAYVVELIGRLKADVPGTLTQLKAATEPTVEFAVSKDKPHHIEPAAA